MATHATSSNGAPRFFAAAIHSSFVRSVSDLICRVTSRRCFTAWTMSPVPASPFVRIIAAPSPIAPQRLAEVPAAAHERHLVVVLVDVVLLVGRREHLGLVDEIHLEGLEDPRFGEVADAALRHHGDRNGRLDLADLRDGRHARDPAVAADVGRDALERHDRGGAGVLGELRLLGVDDVHDDAALEHLGEADLHAERVGREG